VEYAASILAVALFYPCFSIDLFEFFAVAFIMCCFDGNLALVLMYISDRRYWWLPVVWGDYWRSPPLGTELVDGVSVWRLIADGLRHAAGKRSSDVTARTALFTTHARPGSDVKRHQHRILALITYMCWWAVKQANKQNI
jgi:hypothetical protein